MFYVFYTLFKGFALFLALMRMLHRQRVCIDSKSGSLCFAFNTGASKQNYNALDLHQMVRIVNVWWQTVELNCSWRTTTNLLYTYVYLFVLLLYVFVEPKFLTAIIQHSMYILSHSILIPVYNYTLFEFPSH